MSLGASFSLLLEEYPANKDKEFAKNFLAEFVRNDIPRDIQGVLPVGDRYVTKGSVGQGNWSNVPWVAIFDRLITHSAQEGFYLVYLVKEDCSGVYLSLNQGVTTVRNHYGVSAKEALRARAANYAAKLGVVDEELVVGPVDLALTDTAGIASFYESGAILSKYYSQRDVSDDQQVARDLGMFVGLYNRLYEVELNTSGVDIEDDETDLGVEDCLNLKAHKRVERNQKLARQAKAFHGFVCQACDFDFEKEYGEIGREFIEAHHLTPIKELRGTKTTLDPKTDFKVLCSNCHRMIHKTEFVDRVEEFRAKYVVKPN